MPAKSTKVPDGWDNYSNIGKRIPDTPFISFKVPLHPGFGRAWGIPQLVEQCPDLRTVIDLTATDRYYRQAELEERAVNHGVFIRHCENP